MTENRVSLVLDCLFPGPSYDSEHKTSGERGAKHLGNNEQAHGLKASIVNVSALSCNVAAAAWHEVQV